MFPINKRSLVRTVAPVIEPLTLAETKLYLRIDGNEEDTLITEMISVAREYTEHFVKRSLLTQTWALTLEDYAPLSFKLPMGTVQSITSVILTDSNGAASTLNASLYHLRAGDVIEFEHPPYASNVTITYVAGYVNASYVPKSVRYAMLSHIAAMYDNRGEPATTMPSDTIALLTPHREILL